MLTRDAAIWEVAERILTPRQLEALRLHERGLSYRTIALHMDISATRVSALVERAAQKINIELVRMEAKHARARTDP